MTLLKGSVMLVLAVEFINIGEYHSERLTLIWRKVLLDVLQGSREVDMPEAAKWRMYFLQGWSGLCIARPRVLPSWSSEYAASAQKPRIGNPDSTLSCMRALTEAAIWEQISKRELRTNINRCYKPNTAPSFDCSSVMPRFERPSQAQAHLSVSRTVSLSKWTSQTSRHSPAGVIINSCRLDRNKCFLSSSEEGHLCQRKSTWKEYSEPCRFSHAHVSTASSEVKHLMHFIYASDALSPTAHSGGNRFGDRFRCILLDDRLFCIINEWMQASKQ